VIVRDLLKQRIVELAERVGFTFERRTGRYRNNATGRFVAERTLRGLAEKFSDFTAQNMRRHTERFIAGEIDLPTWQDRIAKELRNSYLVSTQIGRGGKNAMTPADYGRIGGRLRFEYRKLNQFALEIKAGMLTDAQILARVQLYAPGARTAYYDGLTAAMKDAELTEERRVLNPAEHCEDCVGYARMGWQPIGTLPQPGTMSRCLHNCQCTMEYR